MARLLIAAVVLAAAITLYGLFDCLLRDRGLIRVLPKAVWAIIIVLVPVLGFVLWYIFGRGSENNPPPPQRRSGPSAPDDDDEYLRKVARDVSLNKHRPEDSKDEDPTTTSAEDSDDESGEHGSEGTKGEGRGHSN